MPPDNPPSQSPISATSGRPSGDQSAGDQPSGDQSATTQAPAGPTVDPVLSNPPGGSGAPGAPGAPSLAGGPGGHGLPGAPGFPSAGHHDPRIFDTSYVSGTSPPQPVPTPGVLFPNLADPAHPNTPAGATGPVPVGSPSDPSAPVNTIGSATPMAPVKDVTEKETDAAPTFFSLYHAATVPSIPWPKAVLEWEKDHPENNHMLETLKSLGERLSKAEHATLFPFIEKVLDEVGGAK
jgi:hypothetical protein